jgi:hypothetical protein
MEVMEEFQVKEVEVEVGAVELHVLVAREGVGVGELYVKHV